MASSHISLTNQDAHRTRPSDRPRRGSKTSRMTEAPVWSGFVGKRLKGFEPSTFCIELRRAPAAALREWGDLQATSHWRGGRRRSRIRADMRRYAAFRVLVRVSARNPRWRFDSRDGPRFAVPGG